MDTRNNWPVEAGDRGYLGFTLYKENRESGDALSRLARSLGVSQNLLQFAGTKDKRGITTQRVNAYKLPPERLVRVMRTSPFGDSIVVGDLRFEERPLRLGAHGGNRFTIVLRDVSCSASELEVALRSLSETGFINYFGLQRFGAIDDAATHKLGRALLTSNFTSVIEMILGSSRDGERDEEANARSLWRETHDARQVLEVLPRRMSIEYKLLEGVVKHGRTDALGAIRALPKSLRTMYLHGYQSYLFNHAASARVRLHGSAEAVAGDLVWPHGVMAQREAGASGGGDGVEGGAASTDGAAAAEAGGGEGGEGGEGSILLEGDDEASLAAESGAGWAGVVPHVVTAEEAAARKYSIDDVLLPMPGFETIPPSSGVADELARIMAADGIEPSMFKHRVPELALPGSYRKLIQRPIGMTWRVMRYDDPQLPLAATDLGRMRGEPEPEGVPDGARIAAVLEFTLPASTYATMCLRELTKQSTELAHQNRLNDGTVNAPPAQSLRPPPPPPPPPPPQGA